MSTNPSDQSPWRPSNNDNNARYGDAYGNEIKQAGWGETAPPMSSMPSPSKYGIQQNAWGGSNKTESEENDATSKLLNTYPTTNLPEQRTPHSETRAEPANKKSPEEAEAALPPKWDESRLHPSKRRILLRVLQLIAAIGSIGFAAGASPYSGEAVPLETPSCLYFLYAVAILTIIWSFFHIFLYVYRLASHGTKLNRIIMTGIDSVLAIFWGVGTIVEITTFRCPPGEFNHWCDFYNVSIFWGMLSFIFFLTAMGFDFYGGYAARRK